MVNASVLKHDFSRKYITINSPQNTSLTSIPLLLARYEAVEVLLHGCDENTVNAAA